MERVHESSIQEFPMLGWMASPVFGTLTSRPKQHRLETFAAAGQGGTRRDKTEQGRTGQDGAEQTRTGQDRAEQDRPGQGRTGQDGAEQARLQCPGQRDGHAAPLRALAFVAYVGVWWITLSRVGIALFTGRILMQFL